MKAKSARRPCRVIFYAGHRGRESPRAVVLDGREVPVERVLSRRRIMDIVSGRLYEEFRCRLSNERTVTIVLTARRTFIEGIRPARRRTARAKATAVLGIALALLAAQESCRSANSPDERLSSSKDVSSKDPASRPRLLVSEDLLVPTYLGGPARRSYGRGPVPERLTVRWKLRIGSGWTRNKGDDKPLLWSGMGWTGQPLLVREEGSLYLIVGGYDHGLRRVEARTGRVVWTYRSSDVIKGTPSVYRDPSAATLEEAVVVVMGSRRGSDAALGDPGIAPVRGVSFRTGRELWRMAVPRTACFSQDCDSSALVAEGILYQAVESGFLFALDPTVLGEFGTFRTPRILKRSRALFSPVEADLRREIPQGSNLVLEGSPARSGDRLYIASGAGHVYGLDMKDLSVVWDFRVGADLDSTVVVNRSGKLLFGLEKEYIPGRGGVLLVDPARPAEDSVVWFFPVSGRGLGPWAGGVVGSVAINDETNAGGDWPALAAFISVDGNLYVVSQEVYGAEWALGPNGERMMPVPALVFKDNIGGGISTPLFLDNRIVACGYDRKVHVYRLWLSPHDPRAPGGLPDRKGRTWDVHVRESGAFTAGGSLEATPLVWEGAIYIGCRDGFLYCLAEK